MTRVLARAWNATIRAVTGRNLLLPEEQAAERAKAREIALAMRRRARRAGVETVEVDDA